ncbi:MAG: hypothetical protein HW389_1063 [Bacteroidetes bacterium]|nr:hypothetical protein [Bacteroidota bacterium]
MLSSGAIHIQFDLESVGVGNLIRRDEMRNRGRRIESLRQSPGKPLFLCIALDVTQRHIQSDPVTGDVVQRIPFKNVLPAPPYQDCHFDLVVEVLGYRWNTDHLALADYGRRRF